VQVFRDEFRGVKQGSCMEGSFLLVLEMVVVVVGEQEGD
jgi:hypothetical protein